MNEEVSKMFPVASRPDNEPLDSGVREPSRMLRQLPMSRLAARSVIQVWSESRAPWLGNRPGQGNGIGVAMPPDEVSRA